MKKESVCNCKPIHECEKLNELVVSHKFNELKTNYKSCGFDRKVPKYCCPSSQEKITAITNYELLSEDPQPQAAPRSAPKGQEISEENCYVFNFPKNHEKISVISALASKKWLNQKK